MMILTPISTNLSNPCEGIELYEQSRPPPPEWWKAGNLALFLTEEFIWVVAAVFFWVCRNEPRLRIVRPLSLNLLLVFAHLLYAIGITLTDATILSCGFFLFCLLFSLAFLAVHFFVRILVYVVESSFSARAGTYAMNFRAETDSSSQITMSRSLRGPAYVLVSVGLGLRTIDEVPMEDILKAKKSWGMISLIIISPSIIPFLIILGVVEPYQKCYRCASFLEVILTFLLCLSLYVLMSLRIFYVAWKLKSPDTHGVLTELATFTACVTSPGLILLLLFILDPGDAEFERTFRYEWLLSALGSFVYWWICCGQQMYAVWRDRSRVHDIPKASIFSAEALEGNENLKSEFEKFCKRHYAVENIHFVTDVMSFKRFFMEKNDGWRKQKAKLLYETYIKNGSVMEVNISHFAKTKIGKSMNEMEKTTNLMEIFDSAVDDITNNVLGGIWAKFEAETKFKKKSPTGMVTVHGEIDDS
jgi:hypothetical protein